jgi:DNA modification methylase
MTPWQRHERIGGCDLYLGNALTIIPHLDPAEAVITDPPYGTRDEAWDAMDEREFARFSMAWMSLALRATPEAIIFGNLNNAVHRLAEMIFPRVRPMIWNKPPGSQLSGASERKRWFAFETIFHCHQGDTWSVVAPKDVAVASLIKSAREAKGLTRGAVEVLLRGKKTGLCYRWEEGACLPTPDQARGLKEVLGLGADLDAAMQEAEATKARTVAAARAAASANAAGNSDVLTYRTETGGRHPCEKPLGLMQELVRDIPAKSILDPFAGSGTTLVACVKEGRRAVGIEQDPGHFETALARVREAAEQPDLFVPQPPAPTQEALPI